MPASFTHSVFSQFQAAQASKMAMLWVHGWRVHRKLQILTKECRMCPMFSSALSGGVLSGYANHLLSTLMDPEKRQEGFICHLPDHFASDSNRERLLQWLAGGANGPPPSTQEPLKSQESKPKYKFQKLWEELSKETHSSGLQAEETAPHRTPRKRRGKRAKLIEQGDSPREPVPQKKKCTAKQQAKEAAAEADMNRKDIAAKLFEQGCKHALFQKVHVQMDLPSGKGHWHEFLDTIVTAKEPQCKSCSLLYAQYIKGQDVDALNFPSKKLQEEIEQYAAEAGKRKRGRPCKGEKKPTDILLSWIQSNLQKSIRRKRMDLSHTTATLAICL